MGGREIWLEAFDLDALAFQLAGPADRFGLFSCPDLRRFFIGTTALHFAPDTLTLHFFLQRLQCLIDVIITYAYIQMTSHCLIWRQIFAPKGNIIVI